MIEALRKQVEDLVNENEHLRAQIKELEQRNEKRLEIKIVSSLREYKEVKAVLEACDSNPLEVSTRMNMNMDDTMELINSYNDYFRGYLLTGEEENKNVKI